MLALIGSPHGAIYWPDVQASVAQAAHPDDFELPWDGRVILLRVSADGRQWTMWNDSIGGIPVFYTQIKQGCVASTLEPVVVAAAKFSANDIYIPGLLAVLMYGHFLADWTLYKNMKVVPPDCVAQWDEHGFHWKRLWTVTPSKDRWETGWDELVDEMYRDTSFQAIADLLRTRPTWILPLSAGLDSRLIAGVGADLGTGLHAYAWGSPEATNVVYSRQIARMLGFPWQRVDVGTDYLVKYRHDGLIGLAVLCTFTACIRCRFSMVFTEHLLFRSYLGFLATYCPAAVYSASPR